MLLRWSEPLVKSKVLKENNVLLVKPRTGAIVRKAHVSQLKGCINCDFSLVLYVNSYFMLPFWLP